MEKERTKLEGQINSKYTQSIINEKASAMGLGTGANSKIYFTNGD